MGFRARSGVDSGVALDNEDPPTRPWGDPPRALGGDGPSRGVVPLPPKLNFRIQVWWAIGLHIAFNIAFKRYREGILRRNSLVKARPEGLEPSTDRVETGCSIR